MCWTTPLEDISRYGMCLWKGFGVVKERDRRSYVVDIPETRRKRRRPNKEFGRHKNEEI